MENPLTNEELAELVGGEEIPRALLVRAAEEIRFHREAAQEREATDGPARRATSDLLVEIQRAGWLLVENREVPSPGVNGDRLRFVRRYCRKQLDGLETYVEAWGDSAEDAIEMAYGRLLAHGLLSPC